MGQEEDDNNNILYFKSESSTTTNNNEENNIKSKLETFVEGFEKIQRLNDEENFNNQKLLAQKHNDNNDNSNNNDESEDINTLYFKKDFVTTDTTIKTDMDTILEKYIEKSINK